MLFIVEPNKLTVLIVFGLLEIFALGSYKFKNSLYKITGFFKYIFVSISYIHTGCPKSPSLKKNQLNFDGCISTTKSTFFSIYNHFSSLEDEAGGAGANFWISNVNWYWVHNIDLILSFEKKKGKKNLAQTKGLYFKGNVVTC